MCHKWFMEEKGQRQKILFQIVFMTKCYLSLFFSSKVLLYITTCIELLENMYSNEEGKKEKEGGMNSIVFNAASFHNDLQV